MAMTINTNIGAFTAQRNLNASAMRSASSLSKLSSGSRVPNAKDDAAAMAIGSRLGIEVAGLRQASLNAGQASSLLQIADGAMSQISDVLTRMKSLAVQASSGQLSVTDRATLNSEFTSLRSEIDRIALDTEFSGSQLLNGGDTVASLTDGNIGALTTNGVSLSFDTSKTATDNVFRVEYDWTDAATDTGNLTVTNMATGASETIDVATLIQAVTGETSTDLTTNLGVGKTVAVNFASIGVTVTLDNNFDVNGTAINGDFSVNTAGTAQTAVESFVAVAETVGGDLTGAQMAAITGLDNEGVLTLTIADNVDDLVTFTTAANAGLEFSSDGINFSGSVAATASGAAASIVHVRAIGATEAFATLDLGTVNVVGASGNAASTLMINTNNLMVRAQEGTAATASFNFRVGTGVVAAQDRIDVSLNSVTTSSLGVSSSTIDTVSNAETAMGALDAAITTLNNARAGVGASQSRLDFAAANLAVAIENSAAAQSALMDTDISAEMTEFTSAQVLVQAGVSMLAQANQQPGLLLKLLG